MKNKILVDIKSKKNLVGSYISPRVNLSDFSVFRIPLKPIAAFFIIVFSLSYLFFNFPAPSFETAVKAAEDNAPLSVEERQALEAQLAELEEQMEQYEDKISEYKKQGKTLQSEISSLDNKIYKLNLQIKAVGLTLSKVTKEIDETQEKIGVTEGSIGVKKKIISELIQDIYEANQKGIIVLLLTNTRLSDMFGELTNLNDTYSKLRDNVDELAALHTKLMDQKEILALEKSDIVNLKSYQENQKSTVQKTKSEKDNLLKTTKGKESEYQKILSETQKNAAQIRSRIFELLGGGELTFEDAYKLAQFAERTTGVRAALILAVLDRESALGKNVGRCDYKTAMHPTRDIPVFLEIIRELGLEKNLESGVIKVSCAISSDGAFGGAMGPAQFIPSTWKLYKDSIAAITGNNPPSPWRNIDAFTATALYLKTAGASGGSVSAERMAAAKYYAGSRWRTYLWTYGERVVSKAKQFQQDIDALNA